MTTEVKKPKPLALTPKELRQDLKAEQARATRLAQLLRRAEQEIEALRAARDSALKIAVWGGRRTEVNTRDEH